MRSLYRIRPIRNRIFLSLAFFATLTCRTPARGAPATYSYPDLVRRLTDLEHLATTPEPGEKGALASSYDRASTYDAALDKYMQWSANGDGGGTIRKQGEASVLADIRGPGCIWRTWSATPGKGHVKVYLDGSEQPAIDLPFTEYFDRSKEPFTRPALVYKTSANGFNNFTPIPFQKSCRIVGEKGWGNYYQFTYSQFPDGTRVSTLALPLSSHDLAALDSANKILSACGSDPAGQRPDSVLVEATHTIAAHQTVQAIELAGPRAITALRVRLALPDDIEQQRTLLRQLTIQITWDDDTQPAVWAPLGDFFGSAAGAVPFCSLPAGYTREGGFYSYWYMPFASKARVLLGNEGRQPVDVKLEITHQPLVAPIETLSRFHAKWHRDAFLPERKDRQPDWTLLTSQGRGRLVGVLLHVWNPGGGWWGEGDEKFFVDGEKFPSTFGTGSEDYFGYAWSSGSTFIQAFHDQPLNENNRGHVSVDRWHIADNVPFQQSIEACIEKYFPNSKPTLYAATAYWYLSPGGKDPYESVPVDQRVGYWIRPEVSHDAGTIEGESLNATTKPAHDAQPQNMTSFGQAWSGASQLFWRSGAAGERLALGLPADHAGRYRLVARFTRAPDYGTFQLSVDDRKIGQPVDLYDPRVTAAAPIELGEIDLSVGKHVLGIETLEKNTASRGNYFGLDYLKLLPTK